MSNESDETRVFQANETPPADALVGSVLAGRYRIEKLLGVGAMGAVYLGQHLKIGRRDAIKVLHSQMARDPDAIARFDRGARNVGAIRHPNVCTIYDFSDTDDGLQYLAMEFVSGEALKDILDREGRLPLQRSVRIIEQVASALQAAHDAGVVHRDLKPANIMIAAGPNGTDAVKVVDFDISKGSGDAVEEEVTRLGFVVGTPEYMSPEQLFGGALDGRSDVYSTALMLYRMLTGSLPFRGDTMQETMSARLKDEPLLRLTDIAPDSSFPPELQAVLDRALKCKTDERTASAAQLAAELRAVPGAVAADAVPATRVVDAATATASSSAPAAPAAPLPVRGLVAAAIVVAVVGISGFAANQAGIFGASNPGLVSPTDSMAAGTELGQQSDDVTTGEDDGAQGAQTDGAAGPQRQTNSTAPNTQRTPTQPVADRSDAAPDGGSAADNDEPTSPRTDAFTAKQIVEILNGQQDLLAEATKPSASVLVAMRDTANRIYQMTDAATTQRAKASWIAANLSLYLGERPLCLQWAARATDLAPNSAVYASMEVNCRRTDDE